VNEYIVGKTKIPVSLKINTRLKSLRLSVSPDGILLESPSAPPSQKIASFMENKQEWIFNEWRRHAGRRLLRPWPEQFVSGSKVLFLGRFCLVERKISSEPHLSYTEKGFELNVPIHFEYDQCQKLFVSFFGIFLEDTFNDTFDRNGVSFGLKKPLVKIIQRKDRWAYCNEQGTLHLGWDLVFLPVKLIEYVLTHEICHLTEMNHGEAFWAKLRKILPDCDSLRKSLVEYEVQHGL
jgi:predicted metal-dependent hydrolase